jgi:hypothetical protein
MAKDRSDFHMTRPVIDRLKWIQCSSFPHSHYIADEDKHATVSTSGTEVMTQVFS